MTEKRPYISIVTPSLNMLPYLKRCVASVKDQKGVSFEHIIVDGDSKDGTLEWISNNDKIISVSGKDRGMYDAINRGIKISRGEICAYLNCDEQYLPGTLKFVFDIFENNREVDILFGGVLLVRPDGGLISYRKVYKPRWIYIISDHLYFHSCAMFWKKKIFDHSFHFDAIFKMTGDMDFVLRVLKAGYRAITVERYLAVFTLTGNNLSSAKRAKEEAESIQQKVPKWMQNAFPFLTYARRIEKFLCGAYFQKYPIRYSIYAEDNLNVRKRFEYKSASFRWKVKL